MQCHECGETISDKAADCPHCGASVRSVTPDDGVEEPSTGGGAADEHPDPGSDTGGSAPSPTPGSGAGTEADGPSAGSSNRPSDEPSDAPSDGGEPDLDPGNDATRIQSDPSSGDDPTAQSAEGTESGPADPSVPTTGDPTVPSTDDSAGPAGDQPEQPGVDDRRGAPVDDTDGQPVDSSEGQGGDDTPGPPTEGPGQSPPGDPEQPSSGEPGQSSPGEPGQSSPGEPGQSSPGEPGHPSTEEQGQPPTGEQGQPPTGEPAHTRDTRQQPAGADQGAGNGGPADPQPDTPAAGAGGQATPEGTAGGHAAGGHGHTTGGGQPVAGPGQQGGGQGQQAGGQGQHAAGQAPAPQGVGTTGGEQVQQGPPDGQDEGSGFDPAEFVGRLPLFPGAAAGVATGVILFTVAVAYAAMIPGARSSTLELGALVLLDLQFGATGHVTPELFGLFDVVSPRPAALGFLYLLPMFGLYTAAKLAVGLNRDDETTLPESIVGGMTVVIGYFPMMVIVFVLASREGLVSGSIVGLFVAGILYPLTFGVIGGLAGGALTGGERHVGTVYGLGAIFVIAIGCFLATFVAAISAPGSPGVLTHVFLGVFSYVAVNVFSFGGGQVIGAAGLLALFVVGLAMFTAAFVRAWRASDNESALRGVAKGTTMAPTYFLVLGFFASVVPWLADSYIQEQIEMEFYAASYAGFLVRTRLTGIFEYVVVVLIGTVLFAVVLGGVAGGLATLLRSEIRED